MPGFARERLIDVLMQSSFPSRVKLELPHKQYPMGFTKTVLYLRRQYCIYEGSTAYTAFWCCGAMQKIPESQSPPLQNPGLQT